MAQSRFRRWAIAAGATIALLALLIVIGLHFAARSVKESIEEALGPEGEAAEINVRLTSIELVDVRIKAPASWPTDSALRAKRIVILPELRQLLSKKVQITRIDVEGGYLSALRPAQGGGLKVLPSIAERAKHKKPEGKERRGAMVDSVHFNNSVIEVFDAATAGKPHRVRLDGVKGTVKDINIPELDTRIRVDLTGVVKGPTHQGTVAIRGWTEVAKKRAELDTQVRNVDLGLFEPYLITKLKSGIDRGTFNLDLKSTVQNNQVNAQGTLTVAGLKLKAADNPIDVIASLPRRAAIGALENDRAEITVPFTLAGNLDDPTFSLSGESSLKTGLALVKAFGMSFEGLARALLIILNGLGSAFGALAPG